MVRNRFLQYLLMMTFCLGISLTAWSQSNDTDPLKSFADRLAGFGKALPQEKVFVHMDNTCYFLGDTIWFKAYTRQTNTGKPSTVSKLLYVELLDNDGYLVERKLIEMKDGCGDGWFELKGDSSIFSGFYELRAYTRWQLNWGEYQHEHLKVIDSWFYNKDCAREYFRDYDKLYSRVFPVYDKPLEPGDYSRDMTLRTLSRYYGPNADGKPKPTIKFYPEGGHLVAGLECRVAFEAVDTEGKYLTGKLEVDGQEIKTQERGRGIFTIVPEAGKSIRCRFYTDGDKPLSESLGTPESEGVALQVGQDGKDWQVRIQASAGLPQEGLGVTVMNEGRLVGFHRLDELQDGTISLPDAQLRNGVHQVTVFNSMGDIMADRLFFVWRSEEMQANLLVEGMKEEYLPLEQIDLRVRNKHALDGEHSLSLAIHDRDNREQNFDNGSILTEMLLCSEIKGFVPNPGWFFSVDDEQHRQALDLLMMTQGWRRFNWRDMAVKGEWEPIHPAEHSQIITGTVHTYPAASVLSSLVKLDLGKHYSYMNIPSEFYDLTPYNKPTSYRNYDRYVLKGLKGKSIRRNHRADSMQITNKSLRERMRADGEILKHEVRVHGEFVLPQQGKIVQDAVQGDVATDKGRFRIAVPKFQGSCLFYLGASDTTQWKKKKTHQWVYPSSLEYPEYYVKLNFHYPRFVKPYDFYMKQIMNTDWSGNGDPMNAYEGAMMSQVSIFGKRGRRISYKNLPPVVQMDAYEAFNFAVDAGLMDGWFSGREDFGQSLAHAVIADMGVYETYRCCVDYGITGMPIQHAEYPLHHYDRWNFLSNLDSVFIRSDYAPRKEGGKRYMNDVSPPEVSVIINRLADDGQRATFRDRFMRLPGFAEPAEFYNPDYSKHRLPEGQKDYRRTLYWNPNLQLDENGEAHIQFYNNSRTSHLSIEAEGQASDGTLLFN